jgi:hypothetical protein
MSKATLVSSIDLDKIHHHRQSRLDEKNVEQHLEWAIIFVNHADHDWARYSSSRYAGEAADTTKKHAYCSDITLDLLDCYHPQGCKLDGSEEISTGRV